jgi:molybdopterin synthase catalytic subunit
MKFHAIAASLLTALDRTKHQAPVWRKHSWKMVGRMFIHSMVDSTRGKTPVFQ